MHVVIAGGHGQIALRLEHLLAAEGHTAVGLVRNPDHVDDVRATGAEAAHCDLEQASLNEVAAHLQGADTAVFAAGAGPGSGISRKETVDRAAAVLFAEAAEQAAVNRFLQISSMGAGPQSKPRPGANETPARPPAHRPVMASPSGRDVFIAYLKAKSEAEEDLRSRDKLNWTILRPGSLTNDAGSGTVTLGPPPLPRGSISRDDVAAVMLALLSQPHGIHLTLELIGGTTPIAEAVATY